MDNKDLYIFRATCINVVDGDTADFIIDVGFKMKTEQRVRFLGVDTPEKHAKNPHEREAAKEAQLFVEEQILNKDVYVRTYKSDSFGRYLAEIFVSEEDMVYSLNDLLITKGYAKPFMKENA